MKLAGDSNFGIFMSIAHTRKDVLVEFLHLPKVLSGLRRSLWSPLRVPQERAVSEALSLYRYDSTGRLVHYDSESRVIEQDSAFSVTGTKQPVVGRQSSPSRGRTTRPSGETGKNRRPPKDRSE